MFLFRCMIVFSKKKKKQKSSKYCYCKFMIILNSRTAFSLIGYWSVSFAYVTKRFKTG